MKVEFDGRTWQLDVSDINLKPAMVIEAFVGRPLGEWADSLTTEYDGDGAVTRDPSREPGFLRSVAAMYWLMLAQNGEVKFTPTGADPGIADVDFPLGAFSQAVGDAMLADAAALAAQEPAGNPPDPTPLPAAYQRSPEPSSPQTSPGSGERPHG